MQKRNVKTEINRTHIMLHWVSIGLIMVSKNENMQLISYRHLMSNHRNSQYVSERVYKNHESPNKQTLKYHKLYNSGLCLDVCNVDKNLGFVKTAETRHPPQKKLLLIHIHLKIDVPAVLVGVSRNTFSCQPEATGPLIYRMNL